MHKLIPVAALSVLTLTGCASTATKPITPATGAPITAPARQHVTYSRTYTAGQCQASTPGGLPGMGDLPDRACTPGATDPAVTQNTIKTTICAKGWTAKIRPPASETSHAKYVILYPAYSLPSATVAELDHLIPLELGGSSDDANLWPEVGTVPNPKDAVENRLHAEVCAGTLTLAKARTEIATDWQTAR